MAHEEEKKLVDVYLDMPRLSNLDKATKIDHKSWRDANWRRAKK